MKDNGIINGQISFFDKLLLCPDKGVVKSNNKPAIKKEKKKDAENRK